MKTFICWYIFIVGLFSLACVINYMILDGTIVPVLIADAFGLAGFIFHMAYNHYHPEASKH